MRALIVANGDPPSHRLLLELAGEAALVIAADGGADRALEMGVLADVAVGDLDSVSAVTRERLGDAGLVLDPDPDRTDLQKAIDYALGRGATEVDIVGAGGARADHALANLSVLVTYRGRATLRLIDDLFAISLIEGQAVVDAPRGTVVSLIAIGAAEGVTTTGLRWELNDYPLEFGTYGVHNEVASRPATIRVRSGDVLLFTGRFVEHHT